MISKISAPKSIRIFKNVFSIALIVLLVYMVNFHELWEALSHLTSWSITLLLAISFLLIYVSALKWKFFIEAFGDKNSGQDVSILRLFNLYLLGYFVNLIMPSYVGGDVVRSVYVGKSIGQHQAFAATVLERFTGLVAMVALAIGCMWVTPLVTFEIKVVVALVACGLFVTALLAISPGLLAKLRMLPKGEFISKHFEKIQSSFHLARKDKTLLVKAMGLSFLYHTITVVNTLVAAAAVGWYGVPIEGLFVVLPLILLVGSLPISPNGLGIQEGAFLYFLEGIGASPAQALGVGLVLRAKSYVLALLGGLVWLAAKRQKSEISGAY